MPQNLSSAAVVIGALRVKWFPDWGREEYIKFLGGVVITVLSALVAIMNLTGQEDVLLTLSMLAVTVVHGLTPGRLQSKILILIDESK